MVIGLFIYQLIAMFDGLDMHVDHDGQIITANAAFLEMAQLASEEQARGEPLDRWVGESSVDLNVLMANLRQHGSVRFFTTSSLMPREPVRRSLKKKPPRKDRRR